MTREKLEGHWFAALVDTAGPEPYSIKARFETWQLLVEFLAEQNALVEFWACGEDGDHKVRHIPAAELARLKQQPRQKPTSVTVTYQDQSSGKGVSYDLEFGFRAAASVQAADRACQRHRSIQLSAHRVLSARNAKGLPDALSQWAALQAELRQEQLPPFQLPPQPKDARDVFVAFEFEVDDQNNFAQAAGLYRASEVWKKIHDDTQVLLLHRSGENRSHEVLGFGRQGLSGPLRPLPNPILGQDVVELLWTHSKRRRGWGIPIQRTSAS